MTAHQQSSLFAEAPPAAAKSVRLPETHVNGSVAPLTREVAGILIEARSMSYQNAVQAALQVIPLIREADRKAGVRT